MPKELKLPVMHRRAQIEVNTFDEKTRSFDVVFATEKPVLTQDYRISERNDGLFYEILSCKAENVRMGRINNGAPLLDTHSRYTVKEIMGVTSNGRVDNNQCVATCRLSSRDDVAPIMKDIQEGIIQNISSNYRVYAYEYMGMDGEIPIYKAIDWEPNEISLVTVPADPLSRIRSDNDKEVNPVKIINNHSNQNQMTRDQIIAGLKSRNIQFDEKATDEELKAKLNAAPADPPTPPTPPTPPAPPAPAADVENERAQAAVAERNRVAQIMEATRSAKLDISFAEKLIKEGHSIEKSRELIISEWGKNDPNVGSSSHIKVTGQDEIDRSRADCESALMHRTNPDIMPAKDLNDRSRAFVFHRLLDIARERAAAFGVKTTGISPNETISRAMSSSDFPSLLANVVNKVLRKAYEEAPQTWKAIATMMNASDFKAMKTMQFGGGVTLEKVPESGEFKHDKLAESAESWALKTYGKILSISRQAIINDDLGGFNRIPRIMANAAAALESSIMWGLITGNVKLADGKEIFHADRKNGVLSSGAAPDLAGIGVARKLMRRQKGLNKEVLNLAPKFIVGPPELETTILQLCSPQFVPVSQGTINPYQAALTPIIEARLEDATAWYMFADPNIIDILVYSYLEGQQGIYTETRSGFEVDGLEIKVRTDFEGAALDYRGMFYNKGKA